MLNPWRGTNVNPFVKMTVGAVDDLEIALQNNDDNAAAAATATDSDNDNDNDNDSDSDTENSTDSDTSTANRDTTTAETKSEKASGEEGTTATTTTTTSSSAESWHSVESCYVEYNEPADVSLEIWNRASGYNINFSSDPTHLRSLKRRLLILASRARPYACVWLLSSSSSSYGAATLLVFSTLTDSALLSGS